MKRISTIDPFAFVTAVMLLISFNSCKKGSVPWPEKSNVIAVYTGTSFTHYTASEFNRDSHGNVVIDPVTHSFFRETNDSLYRPDTLVIAQLGADSVSIYGSFLGLMSGRRLRSFRRNDSSFFYAFFDGAKFAHTILFSSNYDSVSAYHLTWSGISPVEYYQTQYYFNCKKQ